MRTLDARLPRPANPRLRRTQSGYRPDRNRKLSAGHGMAGLPTDRRPILRPPAGRLSLHVLCRQEPLRDGPLADRIQPGHEPDELPAAIEV